MLQLNFFDEEVSLTFVMDLGEERVNMLLVRV